MLDTPSTECPFNKFLFHQGRAYRLSPDRRSRDWPSRDRWIGVSPNADAKHTVSATTWRVTAPPDRSSNGNKMEGCGDQVTVSKRRQVDTDASVAVLTERTHFKGSPGAAR
jgi:hypothetical protein